MTGRLPSSPPSPPSGGDGLPPALLERLSGLVSGRLGLSFPPERWADLARGIRPACREFGFGDDVGACADWLASSGTTRRQAEVLACHLTVGETYFFRERAAFRAIEEHVLPELIAARRRVGDPRLRAWSVGCCTGEEAYSLAITLVRLLPDVADWDVTVLATDVNPRFLRTAAAGVFGEWSFRDVPAATKERFFTPAPRGRYEVLPHVRNLVTFAYLNLAEDAYPSPLNGTVAMDVVFCRNVLIYLGPGPVRRVVGNLARSLADGGWLFVGAAETSHVAPPGLALVRFAGAAAYCKRPHPAAAGRPDQPGLAADFPPPAAGPGWAAAEPPGPPATDEGAGSPPPPAAALSSGEGTPAATTPPATTPAAATPAAPSALGDAAALYDEGRYAEVVERLAPLCSAAPPGSCPAEAVALLARACANRGDLSAALGWCERALAAGKLDARLHYLRATILQEQGAADDAAAAFRRATYLDPDFVMAHVAMGLLARRRCRPREADRHLAEAARLLRRYDPQVVLPESDGMTAGRLAEVIAVTAGPAGPTGEATP